MNGKKFVRALCVLFFLVLMGQTVSAGDQDFQLYNRTGVDIYALYVSPTGADDWQENIMDSKVLLAGADILIVFDPSEEAELWDIRVEDSEGNFLEWTEVDLITAVEVILEADGVARIKE